MGSRLNKFTPEKLAAYERANYVAYYQRKWLTLLLVSIQMIHEAYQLSWVQAIYGAYLIARAEMAFAPKKNNPTLTKSYIRRFYQMLKKIHQLNLNLDEIVEVEIAWWVVHREYFADEQNQPLADAISHLLMTVYQIDEKNANLAGAYRAKGMLLSDQWVRGGLDPRSSLLEEEETMLCEGYRVLKIALEQKGES